MTINIDDFMDEHLADKAALKEMEQRMAAEKEEADRKERIAQDEKARVALNKGRYAIRKAIVEAAIKQGASGHTIEDTNVLFIDGVDVSFYLQFVEERQSNSWRSRYVANGKLRLTVGDFGNRTSYPQKKDGTHNYEAIAQVLRGYAGRKIAEQQAQFNRQRNANSAAELAKEFNLPDYQGLVVPSASAPGMVTIDFKSINVHTMNPDKARKVLKALRELGIKLSYNDK